MCSIKRGKSLSFTERKIIELNYNKGVSISDIARMINRNKSTISREIQKGLTTQIDTLMFEYPIYSSDLAQSNHIKSMRCCGAKQKPFDKAFFDYVYNKMKNCGYSPCASLSDINNSFLLCKTKYSYNTIYRYIKQGLIYDLSMKDLPYGRPSSNSLLYQQYKRLPAGTSIEFRPKDILRRNTFGHWEMDSIIGSLGLSKNTLLSMIERKTRFQLVFKLQDHTSDSVVSALDFLESVFKDNFKNIFKTITCDNGVEFSNCAKLSRSCFNEGNQRTNIYYCHPASPRERGSNENGNRFIRRFISSGTDLDPIKKSEILYIQNYINSYPRKILGYTSAETSFRQELISAGISASYVDKMKTLVA